MRLFHICTKKEYEKDGEVKVKWYKAGILKIADSGRQYIRFFHLPEIDFFVFESNPPEANSENKSETISA